MPNQSATSKTLASEFLTIRSKLIDVAASLDRIERAGEWVADDARMVQIRNSLATLADGASDRAERVELLFSLPYEPNWRDDSSSPRS